MAEVFLAKQIGIGGFEKPVALKRILPEWLESRHFAVDMFLNEAKIAGRLIHPNIVQVLDVGQVGGALYLAMEYVHGRDLRDILKTLRGEKTIMPLGDACYVISQIAQALHHAYWSTDLSGKQLAVIHRDVSPHNVILGHDGSVKLLDFGVAMSAVTEHAGEAGVAGKWAYMSPEQTMEQEMDHRSDLFSLGVMMYLLCTGSMPFAGNDPREIVKKSRTGAFKPVKQAAPDMPNSIAELITRLLSPNPDDRPRTGLEVVTTITEFTRSYGIESSAARIASLVTRLFGEAGEQPEPPPRPSSRSPRASNPSVSNAPRPTTPPSLQRMQVGSPLDQSGQSVPLSRSRSRDIAPSSIPAVVQLPTTGSRMLSALWWILIFIAVAAVAFGIFVFVQSA
jgi:serine/threonine protein kinase